MSRYRLSDHAIRDLRHIGAFIAQDSVEAAMRVLDFLEQQFDLLATTPTIGRERADLLPGVFCFSVGKARWRSRYLIFYRRTDFGIEVDRIIEGHRDIVAALEEPPAG